MEYRVKDFLGAIDKIAPFCDTEGEDNVGLLVGCETDIVKTALFALDVTSGVIDEAAGIGANLIITHHPVIFHPVSRLLSDSREYKLAAAGISVISAHTNLDMAKGGVNDVLAGLLGLKDIQGFCEVKSPGGADGLFIGRIGSLESPMSPERFSLYVKERLGLTGLYYSDGSRDVKTVALCSGDGTSYFSKAARHGIDAYVTGESKHHILLEAAELGVTYIAGGHFGTENIVIQPFMDMLAEKLPDASMRKSSACKDIIRFI